MRASILAIALPTLLLYPFAAPSQVMLGSHHAKYAADGSLLPWTSWADALDREMKWYERCPIEHGSPLRVDDLHGRPIPADKKPA